MAPLAASTPASRLVMAQDAIEALEDELVKMRELRVGAIRDLLCSTRPPADVDILAELLYMSASDVACLVEQARFGSAGL